MTKHTLKLTISPLCRCQSSKITLLPSCDFNANRREEVQLALNLENVENNQLVCTKYGIPVTRCILRRLRLCTNKKAEPSDFYLNDELINFFMGMLSDLDFNFCSFDSTRLKSHFFSSYFMTKLRVGGFDAIKR